MQKRKLALRASGPLEAQGRQATQNDLLHIKKGNSSLEVSALGLGCMRMSYDEDPIPDRQEIKSAISQITVQGDRYPEDIARQTDR